jgi:outer membrane protein TolC
MKKIALSTLSCPLAAAMGYEGELPRLVYSSPEKTAVPLPTESDVELLRAALDHRLDLISQTHEREAASRLESAAHRSLWPRIDARASVYEYASNSPASFISFIGRFLPNLNLSGSGPGNATTDWFLGVHVTFPLFDGGRRRGQIQSAAAQKELAQAAVDKLQSQIRREVRTALADLESAQARVRATEQSVAQAEQVLRNERLKYEAGRSVINFVLDAEAALLTNQSLWRQAHRSVSIAALALDLSVGRISPSSVP